MTSGELGDPKRMGHLLEVGRALVADFDPDAILDRVLEAGRELTGARYAALGVLNESRTELERFLTSGVDAATHRQIGDLPRGLGVLGVLISDPAPLRLPEVGEHPRSYGLPAGHPPMHSFLGVPIMIRGEAWGNLYLTEKESGPFTAEDEEAAIILAAWAATAIDNARLYQTSERRRHELERAVRGLQATRDVAIAIGSETRLERVLELIAKRGRALVDARAVVIMLSDAGELVVVASAGHVDPDAAGHRVEVDGTIYGEVLGGGRTERIADVTARLRLAAGELGVADARTAMLVPLLHRGRSLGVLAAFDREGRRPAFGDEDEQLLRTFSASASNAVALAQSVEEDRLRSSLAAADSERRRWARELHDETLQALGGLRVTLASALRSGDPERKEQAMRGAIEQVEHEIANLRAIIADLRPAALDELGLAPAIEALLERHRAAGLIVTSDIAMPPHAVLGKELESTVYRVLQEALTNVGKHAGASTATVALRYDADDVTLTVSDDGVGFDPHASTGGYGLAGMQERVAIAGGRLAITSDGDGTTLSAKIPVPTPAGLRRAAGFSA